MARIKKPPSARKATLLKLDNKILVNNKIRTGRKILGKKIPARVPGTFRIKN